MFSLEETVLHVSQLGEKKVNKSLKQQVILGFIAGAMISLGYLAYIKLVSMIPGGLGVFLGACVFPIGLIVILLAGGELITGNMMVVGTAWINRYVSLKQLLKNWGVITISNLLGALFITFLIGYHDIHVLEPVINSVAQSKIAYNPFATFVSGIGCNWFVGLAVWFNIAFKSPESKMMGIWFPVMVFVLIGFQHSVANMFLLSASYQLGGITFASAAINLLFSYLGNSVGGVIMVGLLYTHAQSKQ